jgi:hypothetical protein
MTRYTAAQKRYGLNNMNAYAQRAQLGDLVYGAAAGGYPLDYPGKIFYVNNITGSASNDGLSWETAFAQVSTAVTAVKAFQTAQGTASLDTQARCIIYIAGTTTGYTGITALAGYTDYIGVGSSAYGNGTSVPVIGTTTGSGMVATAGTTIRGAKFYNLQFTCGAGATWAVDLQSAFLKGAFVDCSFLVSGTSTTGGCLNAALAFAGNLVQHCQFSGDSGTPAYGIYLVGGGSINNNIFEDNVIGGTTAAVYVAAGDDVNTVWRNNTIGINYGTYGVQDAGSSGHAIYAGNYCMGSTLGMSVSTNPTYRCVGNFVIDAGEGHTYLPFAASTTS